MRRNRTSHGIGRELGRLITIARCAQGLKQRDVAELAEVEERSVTRWECGERVPSAEHVTKLTEILSGITGSATQSPIPLNSGVPSPIRVFLIEDNELIRDDFSRILQSQQDIEIVGEAASAQDALKTIRKADPHLAIVDIRLGQSSGLDLAQHIRLAHPDIKVLILSAYDLPQYVRRAAAIGVQGYLTKDASTPQLVQAVRRIAAGESVLPPQIASRLLGRIANGRDEPRDLQLLRSLSAREAEVLELLRESITDQVIASQLGFSVVRTGYNTNTTHRGR